MTHCSLDEVDLVNIVKPVSRGVCKELEARGVKLEPQIRGFLFLFFF